MSAPSSLVDVTRHPGAVAAGLPGIRAGWDGRFDTELAVEAIGPDYAVDRPRLRNAKEQLRRIYTSEQRARRDHILAEIAVRAGDLQQTGSGYLDEDSVSEHPPTRVRFE